MVTAMPPIVNILDNMCIKSQIITVDVVVLLLVKRQYTPLVGSLLSQEFFLFLLH